MKQAFDYNKEYGIVLEGGGAKGAYQIGVWKAFLDNGVKIKGVAGVSVGALNGALICMGDYERAVDLWKNISYSKVMNVNDHEMDKLMNGKFMELSLQELRKKSKQIFADGGFDITPLKKMLEVNVDEKKIKESDIEFIMGTFSLSNLKEVEITAKEAEEGYLKDYLMASSTLPLFKGEKLHGQKFLDGGMVNNVPIDMLINRGYKDIIVIRVYGIGMEKKIKIPEGTNLVNIAPRVELCNVMEFDKKKATKNITLGYFDALRVLKSLSGREYYIESDRTEADYLTLLLSIEESVQKRLLKRLKKDNNKNVTPLRMLTEVLLPEMASFFKLDKRWEYGDLYFALLEYCAKKLQITNFKQYTEMEFLNLLESKINDKYEEVEEKNEWMEAVYSIILKISD